MREKYLPNGSSLLYSSAMPTSVNPQVIADWLDRNGRSRDWLAYETGASRTTVSGWLAKGKPRPIPIPTLKLIERLICDDLLGENQYSLDDALLIRQAMDNEGYANLREFQRDAVLSMARSVAKAPKASILDLLHPEHETNVQHFPSRANILAAAGSPISAEVTDWDGENDTVMVRISGLSMSPLLNDGDVVPMKHKRISRNPHMKKGLIYLVAYDNGYTVKRYNTRPATAEEKGEEWVERGKVKVLESINPDFPEIVVKQPMEWVAWLDGGKAE